MKLIFVILAAGAAFAQTTRYPGAIDGDSSLFVVADNVQSTLNTAMTLTDSTAIIASAAGFVPNMIATICDTTTNTGKCTAWEHMLVISVAGNVLTVTRGFAGTSARTHATGRLVNILIDSAHQKVLKDSVVAIETALGPNLSNIAKASSVTLMSSSYNFPPMFCNSGSVCTPSGSTSLNLLAGANVLTFTPVPSGVNGSNTNYYLWVSGGTGTAESCQVTGGTGTGGSPTGQIIMNCPSAHSGNWNIRSTSNGVSEALADGGPTAVVAVPYNTPADPGKVVYAPNVTVFDYRPRLASKIPYAGYEAWPATHTTAYNSIRGAGSTPEYMLAIQTDPSHIQNINHAIGWTIPAGSQTYEDNAVFVSCENYGGQGPPAGLINTQNACVAMKATAQAWAPNSPVWGANITASNYPGIDAKLTGIEIGLSTYSNDIPTIPKNGLQIGVAGGTNQVAGNAIDINGTTGVASWRHGIFFGNEAIATGGTAIRIFAQNHTPDRGIDIEGSFSGAAIHIGNPGAPIRFQANTGSDGLIGMAPGGNTLAIQQPSLGDLQFLNGSGTAIWKFGTNNPSLFSTGVAFASLPGAAAGEFIWCTNCNVATPCTAGGTGAWAFSNASRWACPF